MKKWHLLQTGQIPNSTGYLLYVITTKWQQNTKSSQYLSDNMVTQSSRKCWLLCTSGKCNLLSDGIQQDLYQVDSNHTNWYHNSPHSGNKSKWACKANQMTGNDGSFSNQFICFKIFDLVNCKTWYAVLTMSSRLIGIHTWNKEEITLGWYHKNWQLNYL